MKNTEVRIGNCVITPSNNIDTIMDYDFLIRKGFSNIELYKPIELNEEWLLKFGFDKVNDDKDNPPQYYFNDSIHLAFGIVKGGLFFSLGQGLEPMGLIKYVHQLQNLYHALCGEELTIK